MIVIAALVLGTLLGVLTAQKRNGNLADMLQYGAVYAIAFGIVGMLATLIIHRMAVSPQEGQTADVPALVRKPPFRFPCGNI